MIHSELRQTVFADCNAVLTSLTSDGQLRSISADNVAEHLIWIDECQPSMEMLYASVSLHELVSHCQEWLDLHGSAA